MKTRITELLNIQYPIIQGGMMWVGRAELARAVHENMKQAMVAADETQTTLMLRTLRNTARVFKNDIAQQVVEIEARPGDTDFSELQPLVAGARGRERCIEAGDINDGIWTAGQVIGLINDIPTCEELISRMVKEAKETLQDRLASFE